MQGIEISHRKLANNLYKIQPKKIDNRQNEMFSNLGRVFNSMGFKLNVPNGVNLPGINGSFYNGPFDHAHRKFLENNGKMGHFLKGGF